MPILIDGDNLLHVARGVVDQAERAGRVWLCRLLAKWDPRGRRQVTICFDGFRPDSPGDGPAAVGQLSIRYSDNRSADDLIIETIESSSAPRRLIVVSSDREIRTAAYRRRAVSVDSKTFIEQVLKELNRADPEDKREPREKFDGLKPGEAESWLDEFGIDSAEDDEDEFGLLH